jgi:hypothetical protein
MSRIKTIIPFERLSIEEAKQEYGALFFTFQQHFCFSEEQSAKAVSIATGVCPYCWESERGCHCWNDE